MRGFRVNFRSRHREESRKRFGVRNAQKIMSSYPEFMFFLEEEKLQLLNGSCPRHLTKPTLKTWLSYHVGTAKDGSASSDASKRELMHR